MNRSIMFSAALALGLLSLFEVTPVYSQTYGGQATVVKATVKVPLAPQVTDAVADTGSLPTAGGSITTTSISTNVPGLVSAGIANAFTSGSGGTSGSSASVANLNATVLGNTITADVVTGTTNCTCPAASCTGDTTITNLRINGTAVTVTGTVDQTIVLPGAVGRVVVNEQISDLRSKTVNAIHIFATAADLTTTDIVISSARSAIDCGPAPLAEIFSGRGTGVWLQENDALLGTSTATIISDTGQLPGSGGSISTATANAGLAPLLSTGTVTADTSGGLPGSENFTQSNAGVENLSVNALGGMVVITATVLNSHTECQCSMGVPSCAGDSTVTRLRVTVPGSRVNVDVSGQPNQVVIIPAAGLGDVTLIINERSSATAGDISVNALRMSLNLTGLAATNIVLAHAESGIACGLAPTAAGAVLSGRVLDTQGRGVNRAIVTLNDNEGSVLAATTNLFGYYSFDDVPAGHVYIVSASHKRYSFEPRVVSLYDSIADVDFIPIE